MTRPPRVFIGPTALFLDAWLQHDEHVIAYRWAQFVRHSAYSRHVTDYYMWKALESNRRHYAA